MQRIEIIVKISVGNNFQAEKRLRENEEHNNLNVKKIQHIFLGFFIDFLMRSNAKPIYTRFVGTILDVLIRFQMNKEILPSMLDRNSGQIVAISSLASLIGCHPLSAYSASKWAVTGWQH